MWKAALDVLPYAALLALYLLIWITTTADQVPSAFTFKFSPAALSKSLAFGIWNEYYQFFWIWLVREPPMAVLFVFLAAAILVLGWLVQGRDCVRPTIQSLCFALLIGACVAAPTVIAGSYVRFVAPWNALAHAAAVLVTIPVLCFELRIDVSPSRSLLETYLAYVQCLRCGLCDITRSWL